jgi:hypothetical protein
MKIKWIRESFKLVKLKQTMGYLKEKLMLLKEIVRKIYYRSKERDEWI